MSARVHPYDLRRSSISEILSDRHRSEGRALDSFAHRVLPALLTASFPNVVTASAPVYPFACVCGMMVLQLVPVRLIVPEARGRSLKAVPCGLGGAA
jgi:hypothetical protein